MPGAACPRRGTAPRSPRGEGLPLRDHPVPVSPCRGYSAPGQCPTPPPPPGTTAHPLLPAHARRRGCPATEPHVPAPPAHVQGSACLPCLPPDRSLCSPQAGALPVGGCPGTSS